MSDRSDLVQAFRTQARACGELGSPFMAALLDHAASELDRAGSIGGLLTSWEGDPVQDAVPLRLAAALHALVLSGSDPDLAALYPPSDRADSAEEVWRAALAAIRAHRPVVETFLGSPPQTNEVGRSAVLLGGFLEIARATNGKPIRMLEIGASAGLNLLWDRYRYELGGRARWGGANSTVVIRADWKGPLPPLDARVVVAERAGSDSEPVDLGGKQARLRLRAYVWADQPARMKLLDAAMDLVRHEGIQVERSEAAAWVAKRLQAPAPGCATVLYHSIAWEYFPEDTKSHVRSTVEKAGARAGADSPLAWLRLEPPSDGAPGGGQPELRLTLWPGGRERCLARAHTHGPPVTWLDDSADE
ncbi:MAG TPA: DUF2332 family protein [Acetobacteraceae bacterium]|nr:DUF2332 family protein [Acetobacteraceae bacterium]